MSSAADRSPPDDGRSDGTAHERATSAWSGGDRAGRPLLVTGDPDVLDDLLRLAATAGAEVDVAADAVAARRRWVTAVWVLIGPDLAEECVRATLPRRGGVVLLGHLDDPEVWQRAVEVGAEQVEFLPDGEPSLIARFADAADGGGCEGAVVAVVGGRGGAGATTLAAALAVTATRAGRRALLVDGDPLGGGIDLVFGGETDRGLRWRDLGGTQGRVPAGALAEALPRMAGLSVLSWDRGAGTALPPEAMTAVLAAGRRAHDLVVVDLPRSPDDAARVVLGAAGCVLLVVPAEVRGAAAAGRVAACVGMLCRDLRVVVRGPGPGGLDPTTIAGLLGLPLAGHLRPEPGLEAALERGEAPARRGRGPLADLCHRLLPELAPTLGRAA